MTKTMRETTSVVALGSVTEERDAVKSTFQEVQSSFENFCLLAGIEAFQDLLEEEAADLCGERHQRHEDRRGRRWGKAGARWPFMAAGSTSNGFGRRMASRSWSFPALPRASARAGWQATCRLWTCWRSRSARPGGPDPGGGGRHRRHGREAPAGAGRGGHRECRHGSGAARQPRRASTRRWCGCSSSTAALSKAIRRTFGRNTPIQRCQVHKARNIAERLPREAHATSKVRQVGDGARAEHASSRGSCRNGWQPTCRHGLWRETSMAYKQLPTLKAALLAHQAAYSANANSDSRLAGTGKAA